MNAIDLAAIHKMEKVMLHKNSDDDVLLSYGRGALPAQIPARVLLSLKHDDRVFLTKFYPRNERAVAVNGSKSQDIHYLRSIPILVPKAAAESVTEEAVCAAVRTHYCETPFGFLFHSNFLSEVDEIFLARAFGASEAWIREEDRAEIAARVRTIPGITLPDVFYATLFNDLRNYFFYRKHHEHVPGTMLIEAARQGFYAQFYRATGVRPGEVSISMNSLDATFREYTNPNYPVRIMVEDADPGLEENNQRQIHKRATFQQSGKIVGKVEMRGQVMKMRHFKRMRNVRSDETHRFTPVKNVSKSISLDDRQGNKYECALKDISIKGFNVTFKAGSEVQPGTVFDYVFFVEGMGFIHGHAALVSKSQDAIGAAAELAIMGATVESDERLCEVIKNYTHVITTEGVF